MHFHIVIILTLLTTINGQKTGYGACSTGQDDDRCEIQNGREELELQSEILQKIWDKMVKQERRDCLDILNQGHSTSGVYEIYQPDLTRVYCDMETDGGGWTVLLNRESGDVDFDRTWIEYKHGFGDLSGNHWLGNEHISKMTAQGYYKLRIDLSDWDDSKRHAVYSFFRVGSEFDKYQLIFDEYFANESNVNDSLSYHNGMFFSTKDRDNDEYHVNCAADLYSGAFWSKSCQTAGLTNYYGASPNGDNGKRADDVMNWRSWHGYEYSLKTAKMMIRPMN